MLCRCRWGKCGLPRYRGSLSVLLWLLLLLLVVVYWEEDEDDLGSSL